MTKVLNIPGTGCRYYFRERCLYHERLNPGLDTSWRCTVLTRLDERFDRLVEQEHPSLTLEQAGRIWHGWCESALSGAWDCPEYEYCIAEDGEEACLQLFEDVCLLRMPICDGRCAHFGFASPLCCDE